jgi:hypothetical protein
MRILNLDYNRSIPVGAGRISSLKGSRTSDLMESLGPRKLIHRRCQFRNLFNIEYANNTVEDDKQ